MWPVADDTSLAQAVRNQPPIITGSGTAPADGVGSVPRSCPAAGARVEQRGGPTMEYAGAAPSSPDLCEMRVGGTPVQAWFGIWLTDWAGAAPAEPALRRVLHGRTGEVAAFDTSMLPGMQWHDVIRNEGVEQITLLGHVYRALRLSHYREGYDGNVYRSVSTVWKDIPSGMLIYGTYQHINGRPEIDDPILPTAIVPAPRRVPAVAQPRGAVRPRPSRLARGGPPPVGQPRSPAGSRPVRSR